MINTNTFLSTIGMITGVVGATLIALNMNLGAYGYMLFLVSSISWLILAFRTSQHNLLLLNLCFASINCIGLYNYS